LLAFPKPQAAAIPPSCISPLPKIVQQREAAGLDWWPKLSQSRRATSKFYEDCCYLATCQPTDSGLGSEAICHKVGTDFVFSPLSLGILLEAKHLADESV